MNFKDWLVSKNTTIIFQYNITDDCNLKCNHCNVGCDVVQNPFYVELNQFKTDMKRLKQIIQSNKHNLSFHISLLGGEPLLHPDLVEMISFSRNLFKDLNISIDVITNGINLLNMPNAFYYEMQKENTFIVITKFPININYNIINKELKNLHIKHSYMGELLNDWNFQDDYIENTKTIKFAVVEVSKEKQDCNIRKCLSNQFKDRVNIYPTIYKDKIFTCPPKIGQYIKNQLQFSPQKDYNFTRGLKENNFKGDYSLLKDLENIDDFLSFVENDTFCSHCHCLGQVEWSSINPKSL